MKSKLIHSIVTVAILALAFPSCRGDIEWEHGQPLPKRQVKVAVIHSNHVDAYSLFDIAHYMGISGMKKSLNLQDSQIIHKVDVHDADLVAVEMAMRDSIAAGANIIIATSWGHKEVGEKLALEYPSVVFANLNGFRHNERNLTSYALRFYQARYLAGIVAGMKTQTGKIGFVAAMGTANSYVTGGINAFARGVAGVNPEARVYVWVTHSWFDPMGENYAAQALIAYGCDVIAQHTNTIEPQMAAQRAGVWSIGSHLDMSQFAPDAVITSVVPRWGTLYTRLVRSVIDGTFRTTPRFYGIADGMVDITPINERLAVPEIEAAVQAARQRIIDGSISVFHGILETNDGSFIGEEGKTLSDEVIRNSIDWYYRNVVVMR